MHMALVARIFGAVLAVLGALYGAVALYMLFTMDGTASVLEMAKAPQQPEFGFMSIDEWKAGVRLNSWLFLAVGTTAIVCGVGIVALREWARRSWLVVSVLLVVFVGIVAVGYTEGWKRYVELLVLALPSFIVLYGKLGKGDRAI